ncbi:MAG: glycosyltransferase family 2 protein [Candidatus Baltobacteraceae bacterium]
MTDVSVVIPALNAESTLGETLRALRSQARPPAFELIVVDNGSTDGTKALAHASGARVLDEIRRGPAAARNCGLRAAQGAIVVHLDADTVPSRRWLSEIVKPFAEPETVLVSGHTLCYPPQTPAERYVQAAGLYDAQIAAARKPFPFAPSLNLAVRAAAARAVGGWNEALLTGEDVDFSYRLQRAYGEGVVYCADAVLYHRARADDAALRRQARSYGAGVADLYRMYPCEVQWDAAKALRLCGVLLSRALTPAAAAAGCAFGILDQRRAEFLRYQSLWTKNFWLGFGLRAWHVRRGGA